MVQTESENKQIYQQSEEEAITQKKDASININFNRQDFKSSKSREEAKVEVKVDLWKESIIEDLKSSNISGEHQNESNTKIPIDLAGEQKKI